MAVDHSGATVNTGDHVALAGVVREIDGDTLLVTTADGKHVMRVKSTDTRRVAGIGSGGGVTDHGALTGLSDNDHPQYAQKSAAVFDTVAPTSSAAPSLMTNDFARMVEVDAYIAYLNGVVLGYLAAYQPLIADGGLTLAKLANQAAATVVGRASGAGTGAPSALSAAQLVAIIQSTGTFSEEGHSHGASEIEVDDGWFSGVFSGQGFTTVRDVLIWLDSNLPPP